jgi:hypothetical protein
VTDATHDPIDAALAVAPPGPELDAFRAGLTAARVERVEDFDRLTDAELWHLIALLRRVRARSLTDEMLAAMRGEP